MHPSRLFFSLVSTVLLALATPAAAVPVATNVSISSISPCPSFCGGSGAVTEYANQGGEGDTFAATSLNNATNGVGQGEADLTGGQLLPNLRAEAFANTNARVEVGATGHRAYDYVGSGETLQLDITLTGEEITPSGSPTDLDALVQARIAVILGDDLDLWTDPAALLFEVIPGTPGLSLVDELQLNLDVNAGLQSVTGTISVPLSPGDRVFFWANLRTRATRGSTADAFDTLTLALDDVSNLVAVPEPGVAWLLGAMLALAAREGVRKRR
jgi:hypothetical protein